MIRRSSTAADDEPVQWPPDAPVIEASQGQAADYLEWLRQYAEALLHGDPAPEPLRDLPDPPPLLYQLLKQSIERTAERDASAYGLFYSMAGALTTRSGLQAPPADRAGRIESVHKTASRATAGQLRAFDTFLKGTKTPTDTRWATPRAIPLDDPPRWPTMSRGCRNHRAGADKRRALLTVRHVEHGGVAQVEGTWWAMTTGGTRSPTSSRVRARPAWELAEALAILRDTPRNAWRICCRRPSGCSATAWTPSHLIGYERLLAMRQKTPDAICRWLRLGRSSPPPMRRPRGAHPGAVADACRHAAILRSG